LGERSLSERGKVNRRIYSGLAFALVKSQPGWSGSSGAVSGIRSREKKKFKMG